MWQHSCSPRRQMGIMGFVLVAGIFLVVMSRFGFNGFWWIFFLFPLAFMPKWSHYQNHHGKRRDDFEKPKRDTMVRDAEKPKRNGQYVERDDGTVLEVIEDQPKRRDDEDDIFYV